MTTTITPEALDAACLAYYEAGGDTLVHPNRIRAALEAALPELLAAQPSNFVGLDAAGKPIYRQPQFAQPMQTASSAGGQEPFAFCDPADIFEQQPSFYGSWAKHMRPGMRYTMPLYAAPVAGEAAQGITPEWVLGYFDTDLPERARNAVRYAFAEYAALASTEAAPQAVDP